MAGKGKHIRRPGKKEQESKRQEGEDEEEYGMRRPMKKKDPRARRNERNTRRPICHLGIGAGTV